jgi:hypothetical protein
LRFSRVVLHEPHWNTDGGCRKVFSIPRKAARAPLAWFASCRSGALDLQRGLEADEIGGGADRCAWSISDRERVVRTISEHPSLLNSAKELWLLIA